MLQQFFGTELDFWVRLAVSLIVIAALLGLTALILRKMSRKSGTSMVARPRTGRARLSVVDAVSVDQERRLVLVRRDDTEHLLLTGGASDLVVEHNIPVRVDGPQTVREAIAPRTPEQVAVAREPVAAVSAPVEKPAFPVRGEKALQAPSLSGPEEDSEAEPLPLQELPGLRTPETDTEEPRLPETIRTRHARRTFEPAVAVPLAAAASFHDAGTIRPRMPAPADQAAIEEKPETEADAADETRESEVSLISEADLLDTTELIVTGPDEADPENQVEDITTQDESEARKQVQAAAAAREAEERAAIEAAEQAARAEAQQAQEREAQEALERAAAREAAEAAAREEEARAAIEAAAHEAAERAALEAARREAEQSALEAAAREAEAREQAEREAAARAAIAAAEREAQAKREAEERAAIAAAEQEAAERAAREAAEKEAAERAAYEAAARAAAEQAAAERAAIEAAERAAIEAAEREAQEVAEREAREAAERAAVEQAAIEAAAQEAAAVAAFEAAAREEQEREAAAHAAREAHEAAEREAARQAAEAQALDERIAAEMAEVLQEMEKERLIQTDITVRQDSLGQDNQGPDNRVQDIASRLDTALNAPQESLSQDSSPHLSLSDLLDDLQDTGNSTPAATHPVMPEAPHVDPLLAPEPPTAEPRASSRFGQIFSRTGSSYGRPRIDASPRTPVAPPRPPLRTEPLARPRNLAGSLQRDPAVPLLGPAQREPQSVEANREQASAPRIRPPSPMTSRRADLLPSSQPVLHPMAQTDAHLEDRTLTASEKPLQNDPATDFLEDFESEIANLLGRTPGSRP